MIELFSEMIERISKCPDMDTSKFKHPLDSRIYRIKDISESEIFPGSNILVILADSNGKSNGKAITLSCPEKMLELGIINFIYPFISVH